MLDKIFWGLPLHRFFYITALVLIAVGVCLNKVVMSVGTIMLISSWVLEGGYKEKLNQMKGNLPFWLGISLYLLHIIGLFWTSDFNYGFHDLRAKLPLIVLPFVLASIPPVKKFEYKIILYFFISSVLVTSIFNFLLAKGIIPSVQIYNDFRDYSYFISHIRFSLMIDFAIFILIYFVFRDFKRNYLWLIALMWLLYYTYFSQIISGFFYLFILSIISALYIVFNSKKKLTIFISVLLSFTALIVCSIWINSVLKSYYSTPLEDENNLAERTINGGYYLPCENLELRDNGYLSYCNICEEEIRKAWSQASKINLDTGKDQNGFLIKYTLYRYMASKGLKKDSLGFTFMNEQDVLNVENGIYSLNLLAKGMESRVKSIAKEYEDWKANSDPNGRTLMQRLYYWEAGLNIFKKNWIFGVGTGDVQGKFNQFYIDNNSPLNKELRHRSHNQFLTFGIAFGVFGMVFFALYLIYPFYHHRGKIEFLHLIFICLMLLSFLPEDTLETQSGISFFALFYSLYFYRERSNS